MPTQYARAHLLPARWTAHFDAVPGRVFHVMRTIALIDINGFRRWAAGTLVDNRNRGIYAEWLVGQALGAIDASEFRQEWDVCELQYRHASIEVKASGLSQYWSPLRRSRPSFGITVPDQIFCKQTKKRQANVQGTRPADVYSVLSAHIAASDQCQRRMPLHLGVLGDFRSNARRQARHPANRATLNAGPPR